MEEKEYQVWRIEFQASKCNMLHMNSVEGVG